MTRHGPRSVLAAGVSGNPNPLVRLEFGATSLTITEDHPILIGDQWIPAGDIKIGDFAWVIDTSAQDMPIGLSTSSTSALYQPVGLFTTGMKTRATTIRRIWRRCLAASIRGCTLRARQLRRLRERLQRGLCRLLVGKGLAPAFSVGSGSLSSRLVRQEDSAVVHAEKSGVETHLSQSSEFVLSAQSNIWPLNAFSVIAARSATTDLRCAPIVKAAQVTSVERLANSLTYNLTVEGEHEFIANGVVVHNCDELAAWEYIQDAWDQIQFGVRLGKKTRTIITTTPRPKDLILELLGRDGDDVVVTTASTYENLDNLSDNFRKQILQYEGTKLGRQEIYAEIIDPEEGGIVKRDWFKLWPAGKAFPKFEYIVQSYDCATSEKMQNDPTASSTWGVFKPLDGPMSVMLIDCWNERLQYPDLRPKVIDEYDIVYGEGKERKRVDLILVEDKSAGISLIQDLQRAHLPVRAYNPGRADKVQRMNIVSNIIARGRVWIPESDRRKGYVKDWAEGFVSQLCAFPETTHDDYVDTATQVLRYLRDAGWLDIDPPPKEDWDEEDYEDSGKTRRENPYAQ